MKSIFKYTLLALLITPFIGANAQKIHDNVYKKYILKDTTLINKDCVLLLYNDQTFLNFGLVNNKAENDAYVWYAAGKWNKSDSTIVFNPSYDKIEIETLKKEIKQYYKKRSDYRLIESYYEFVKEFYKERRFRLNNIELEDPKKLIKYIELNT